MVFSGGFLSSLVNPLCISYKELKSAKVSILTFNLNYELGCKLTINMEILEVKYETHHSSELAMA